MSKNEASEGVQASDLLKSMHALQIDQSQDTEKTATQRNAPQHDQKKPSAPRRKKQPTTEDGKANDGRTSQSWRSTTQPPALHRGPNVTTRSQTQAANSWRTTSGKSKSQPKQFLLPRPRPARAYLAQASGAVKPSDEPRELLVILDLNGTLVHRESRKHNANFTKRPFCKEFIQYLAAEHKIMIWSSSREHNVERLCKSIFDEVGIELPVHRWHRGHFRLSQHHFDMNVQLYKQLTWIWKDAVVKKDLVTSSGTAFDQSNTILIDDSLEKALSEPYNLIRVDEYDGTDQESDVLGKVIEYLERARKTQDVSCFMRESPFAFQKADAAYAWPQHQAESGNNEGDSTIR